MGGPIGLLVDGDMVTVRPGKSRTVSGALRGGWKSKGESKSGAGTMILDDFKMIDTFQYIPIQF